MGRSIMMMKCAFFKQKIATSTWNARRILLPLTYDNITGAIMSCFLRGVHINPDESSSHNHSHDFPGIPDQRDAGVTDARLQHNIRRLDEFKQALWCFVNDTGIDDICDYEVDSYGHRYFFLIFKYLLESSSDVMWIRGGGEQPTQPTTGNGNERPRTVESRPADFGTKRASEEGFVYSRREDVIAYELLYNIIPTVFGQARLLEMVPLYLGPPENNNSSGVGGGGGNSSEGGENEPPKKVWPPHGMEVSVNSGSPGILVEAVNPNSPMFAKVNLGDVIVEVLGNPTNDLETFESQCQTERAMLLVHRAM